MTALPASRLPAPLLAARNILTFLLRSPTSAFGLLVLSILILTAAFAPWIATHDPYAQDLNNVLQAPGKPPIVLSEVLSVGDVKGALAQL